MRLLDLLMGVHQVDPRVDQLERRLNALGLLNRFLHGVDLLVSEQIQQVFILAGSVLTTVILGRYTAFRLGRLN